MPEPIDEQAARTPGFRGGPLIRFADGSELHVPLPRVRYRPDDSEAGVAEVWNFGEAYEALHLEMLAADTVVSSLRAEFRMAAWLLGLNYALTPAQLGSLLEFGVEGESEADLVELRGKLIAVGLGREPAPKPSGDGSDYP